MSFKIKMGISARHLHLSKEHLEILFGKGAELHEMKMLAQPGQYAAEERVELVGPKGSIKNLRVIGPLRPETQVELSCSDARSIGVQAPVRNSGDTKGSAAGKLIGPAGTLELKEGIIVAARHVHLSPETGAKYDVKDKDIVKLKFDGARALIFDNVLARVHETCADEIHIDTDEGNACLAVGDMMIEVIK